MTSVDPMAFELTSRMPGDAALEALGRKIWQAWVTAFATGNDDPFLAHIDEHARLYFPLGEVRGWHRGRDAIAKLLKWETDGRGGAPLIIDALYRVSHDGQTIVVEFADHSDFSDEGPYENGVIMFMHFENGKLIEYSEYLGSVNPVLISFAGGRYPEDGGGLETFNIQDIQMPRLAAATAAGDERMARLIADQSIQAIDLFKRTGEPQTLLALMPEDVVFWYPAGKWRGLTTGKTQVAAMLEDLASQPATEIREISCVTQKGGTVVYATRIGFVDGDGLTRIAWSIDVVEGQIVGVREYVGDANQLYLERHGARFE